MALPSIIEHSSDGKIGLVLRLKASKDKPRIMLDRGRSVSALSVT